MNKKILLTLVILAAVVAGLALAERTWLKGVKPAAGVAASFPDAPKVALKDLQGKDVSLEQFRGKVVLVNFWATWCQPCRIEIPWFVEFEEKYGSRGLVVLGVAMDEEGKSVVEPYVRDEEFEIDGRKVKMNYPILLGNDDVAAEFGGLIGLPTTLVISRHGKIVKRFIGLVNHELILKEIEGQL